MITQFKIFENEHEKPDIGDYVICKDMNITDDYDKNIYLLNNIGQIVSTNFSGIYPYEVKYENMPDNIRSMSTTQSHYRNKILIFNSKEILHWSKNKKDLEPFIHANKFNL